jgi:hypothetical protein
LTLIAKDHPERGRRLRNDVRNNVHNASLHAHALVL